MEGDEQVGKDNEAGSEETGGRGRRTLIRYAAGGLVVAALIAGALVWLRGGREQDRLLRYQQDALDEAKNELLTKLEQKDPELADPEFFESFFGVEEHKKRVENLSEKVAKLRVTERDARGLDAYCLGKYERARRLFRKKGGGEPGREFPLYFLGTIAFDEGRYAAAGRRFAEVAELNSDCRLAHLMRRVADLCAGDEPQGAADLSIKVGRARRRTMRELELQKEGKGILGGFRQPLMEDPVLHRARNLLIDIKRERNLRLAPRFLEGTPEDRLAIALMAGEGEVRRRMLDSLEERYPEHRDVRTLAFMARYGDRDPCDRGSEQYDRELNEIIALNEGNGALRLLRIPFRESADEPFEEPPLDEAERHTLRRAVEAPRFKFYQSYGYERRVQITLDLFGGFANESGLSLWNGWFLVHLRNIAQRGGASVEKMFEQGKETEARAVAEDVLTMGRRFRQQGQHGIIGSLIAIELRTQVVYPLVVHAATSGNTEVFERRTAELEKMLRRQIRIR